MWALSDGRPSPFTQLRSRLSETASHSSIAFPAQGSPDSCEPVRVALPSRTTSCASLPASFRSQTTGFRGLKIGHPYRKRVCEAFPASLPSRKTDLKKFREGLPCRKRALKKFFNRHLDRSEHFYRPKMDHPYRK